MVKYYCDYCQHECTGDFVKLSVKCGALLPNRQEIQLQMCRQCAISFLGKDEIAKKQQHEAERKAAMMERKAKRKAELESWISQRKDGGAE